MPAASSSSSSAAPLIKGYLPVRLRLPTSQLPEKSTEDTFFFVREHQGKTEEESTKRGTTLFVANAPVVPNVSTKLLLKSIFGRFAQVTKVTAVQNPRAAAETDAAHALTWTTNHELFRPTFLPPILSEREGKFAHVVFESPKELKKAKKAMEDLMTTNNNTSATSKSRRRSSKGGNNNKGGGVLVLDKLELQTLSDESQRQWDEHLRTALRNDDDDDSDEDDSEHEPQTTTATGVLAVAQRYRATSRLARNRSKLLEECNAVMQAYEEAEEAKRLAQEASKAAPDDDGFVTVSYSNAVGSKIEFEQSATATTPSRRKGNKRTRRKKDPVGSGELQDFYRFQRADHRKRTMEDLRRQFEEDVRKVKRLKEEKEYRPF